MSEPGPDADPLAVAADLFRRAEREEPVDPTRFVLSTVSADGAPSARFLLLKSIDARGFGFVTNHDSRKGRELANDPRAALAIHWTSLDVQIRAEGVVEAAAADVSDAYFASRPRESQLGAWASEQSRELPDRARLEARLAEFEARFAGVPVPRPSFWGYCFLVPQAVELWYGRPSRLHDRFRFERDGRRYRRTRLYP